MEIKRLRKNLLMTLGICLVFMVMVPLVGDFFIAEDAKVIAAIVQWYLLYPCISVGIGWWAGWDIPNRWPCTLLCGLCYMLGDLITYRELDTMLLIYGGIYALLSAAGMGLCWTLKGGQPRQDP